MTSSAHVGKTVVCSHDDSPDIDDLTELTYEDNGRFVSTPRGEDHYGTDLRHRFESSALRFDCPDCDRTFWVCPVCSEPDDSDDNSPAGWFVGESTGDQIACHNCNQAEAARQMGMGR
jgi:hypothetical protein